MQLNIPQTCEGTLDYKRELWSYPCALEVPTDFFTFYPTRNANGQRSSVDLILEAHKLHHDEGHTAPTRLTMFADIDGLLEAVECCVGAM